MSILATGKPSAPVLGELQNVAGAARGAVSLAAAAQTSQTADKVTRLISKVEAAATNAVTAGTWMAGVSSSLSGLGSLINQTWGSSHGRLQS